MSRCMMKLIKIIFLSLVISFCFIGCGQKSDDNDKAEKFTIQTAREVSQYVNEISEKKGYVIVFKCKKCGMIRKNIAAKDDNMDLIIELSTKQY